MMQAQRGHCGQLAGKRFCFDAFLLCFLRFVVTMIYAAELRSSNA
jgi:hypothetical protein